MLDLALIGSALLMGVAGSVHCVAMCAAPCAAVTGGQRAQAMAFQGGRLVSYAVAGAVAASSVGLLWQWEQAASWLRPVWLALHLAVLALGLWLLWRGEQPAWMQRRWGLASSSDLRVPMPNGGAAAFPVIPIIPILATTATSATTSAGAPMGAVRGTVSARPMRAAAAGLAWVAWPCGLLQSALLVAALASGPVQGAAVMAAFALGSSPGLVAGPWLLKRLADWHRRRAPLHDGGESAGNWGDGSRGDGMTSGASGLRWATRLSGFLLSAAAIWALGHGLWLQIRAYCG